MATSLSTTLAPSQANSLVRVANAPCEQTVELSVRNQTVREVANDQPALAGDRSTDGRVNPPGRRTGLGLHVPDRLGAVNTADNQVVDKFAPRQASAATLSELKLKRRLAQRADLSFDLDGDGVVSHTDYFYATKFDADGSGHISRDERLRARRLMREESDKLVFLRGGKGAADVGHRVMQSNGAILSEQLDGWASLTRNKLGTAAGPVGTAGVGSSLPFKVDPATARVLSATGAHAIAKESIDIDMDDSDNVALMHVKDAKADFDTVQVKTGTLDKHYQAAQNRGLKSASELKALRKSKMKPDMSYDLDGDAQVSHRDYFFAQRFDADGDGVLTEEERAAAATAMKSGFGRRLAFLRSSGPSDGHHRVMQREGVILSAEMEGGGGYNQLLKARSSGNVTKIGADGQIKGSDDDEGAPKDAISEGEQVHKVEFTENGKIAFDTVKGAQIDFDNVVTKPAYRPDLYKVGARTRSELLRLRRANFKPDSSYDLDGDGTVSQADYWFASRYDYDGNYKLDEMERRNAQKDYEAGFQNRFITLDNGAGMAGQADRVFVVNGQVYSDGRGMLNEDEQAGGQKSTYDKTQKIATVGAVPGLDLPADRMMLPKKGVTRSGALAGTYVARVEDKTLDDGPVVTGSMGIIPGVARAVLRYPDGKQEAYGGYAGGLGAGPVNNMTGTIPAVLGATFHTLAAADQERAGEAKLDQEGRVKLASPPKRDPNFVSYHNETSFDARGGLAEVYKKAPWALDSVGGAVTAVHMDQTGELASTRSTAAQKQLMTRTQLVAARRAIQQSDSTASARGGVPAGMPSGVIEEHTAEGMGQTLGVGGAAGDAHVIGTQNGSTMRVTALPGYMLETMKSKTEALPVLQDELPHEIVKPGSLPESVRCAEATTQSALHAARRRELMMSALVNQGLPEDIVPMPDLYPPAFTDHHSHGRPLVAVGQAELSKTKTQLEKKRFAERVEHAMAFEPVEAKGVHATKLDKFTEKLGEDKPFFMDTSHCDAYHSNFAGSVLDGKNQHGPGYTQEQAKDPNCLDVPLPQYDSELRHTMRDTHANGHAHLASTTRPDVTTGLSGKALRLIKNGLQLEEEGTTAAAGDPFKIRTIHPRETTAYLKKHILLADKPIHEDPWQVAEIQNPQDPMSTFKPYFTTSSVAGRPLYTLHKNNSHMNNGLPGPIPYPQMLVETARQALPQGAKWTHAIIDYNKRLDPTTATDRLEPDGKQRVDPRKDNEPMYSSFTADRVFSPVYVGPGHTTGRIGRPAEAERKGFVKQEHAPPEPVGERTSLYGEAADTVVIGDRSAPRAGREGLAQLSVAVESAARAAPPSQGQSRGSASAVVAASPMRVACAPAVSPSKPRVAAGSAASVVRSGLIPTSPLVAKYPGQALKFGFRANPEGHAQGLADSLASAAVRTGSFAP